MSTPASASLASGEPHFAKQWVLRRLRNGHFELLSVAVFDLLTGARSISNGYRRAFRMLLTSLIVAASIAVPALVIKAHTTSSLWIVWLWSNGIGLVAAVSSVVFARRFFAVVADGLVRGLERDEDVIVMSRWLRKTFAMPRQILFTALLLTVAVPATAFLVTKLPKPQPIEGALIMAAFVVWLGCSGGWYLVLALLSLPTTLARITLPLFPFDPAHSRPIEALSGLVRLGLLLAGANAMLLVIGVVWWDPLKQSWLATGVGMLWVPLVAVFVYHHLVASSAIRTAKRVTIDALEQQVKDLEAQAKVNRVEETKPVLDMRERVAKSRDTAVDWRQMVALLVSLMLPTLPPALKVITAPGATPACIFGICLPAPPASSAGPAGSAPSSAMPPPEPPRPDEPAENTSISDRRAPWPTTSYGTSTWGNSTGPTLSDTPPTSFAGRKRVVIEHADSLGCEARSATGFLEFLCRKQNYTGGRPLRAHYEASADGASPAENDTGTAIAAVDTAASNAEADSSDHADAGTDPIDDGRRVQPVNSDGELRLVLRFRNGESHDVTLEFTDTRYMLHLRDGTASLEWAGASPELAQICSQLLTDSQKVVDDAQLEDAVDRAFSTDLVGLPLFGKCHEVGFGAWALALRKLMASGSGAERRVTAEVELVHASERAEPLRAPFATFEFSPGGLRVAPVEAYDFDADGSAELIVPYELTSVPRGIVRAHPPSVWSSANGTLVPHAGAPTSGAAGIFLERPRGEMRPDLSVYEPYVAWPDADCGSTACPTRLTGPLFIYRATAEGFSLEHDAARAALKRSCPFKPERIVVPSSPQRTAMNLVCSRLRGVSEEVLLKELEKKRPVLCHGASTCGLSTTLEGWTKLPPPTSLG